MARIEIDGIGVEYELLGPEGAQAVAITPGGRFPMDTPGVRELAVKLAEGGRRVLIWDRPNCGYSDVCFEGPSESQLHGRVLTQMIRKLELGPTCLAAGSAGSRVSLVAASRDPEVISHLTLWWISGGLLSLLSLAWYYVVESALIASDSGMEGVAASHGWAEQCRRNPKNRERMLAMDPKDFVATMDRWAQFFLPQADSPVPGMSPETFAALKMPVRIYQNGISDISHTRATSEWVHKLIPHSELVDPPWPDDEWNHNSKTPLPDGRPGLFSGWPAIAPSILEFTAR
jgi:pimeloyl-ACP methyl ester carboxylesterase